MRRVPAYRQLESIDCGPTCIRMLAAYYGKKYTLKTIKDFSNITRIGISLKDIVDCCKLIGFNASSVRISLRELEIMPLPAILYWRQGHYIVLESIKKHKAESVYNIIDPEYGRVELSRDLLIQSWVNDTTGLAIAVEPQADFMDINPETLNLKSENRKIWDSVLLFLHKYKKKFILTLLLSTCALIANWAMPILLQKTIDQGVLNKDISLVWTLLLGQMAFFIGYILASNTTDIILSKTGFMIGIDLISEYLQKIISLPMKFFDTRFNSDLIQRLNDQERIKRFLTETLDNMLFVVLNLIVFSGILLYYNYYIFLLFVLFSLLSILWTRFFLKKRRYIDYSRFTAESIQENNIYELVYGMSEIKVNNAQDIRIKQWEDLQDNINKVSLKSLYIDYYLSFGISFFNRLKDIIITGICAFYVIYSDMTLGTMMTISYLLGQLSGPITQIISFSKNLQDAKLSYERLEDIKSKPGEGNEDKLPIPNITHGITLKNLSFKYEGSFSPYVLKNINLEIKKGCTTAIVGISGSGKTTLLKLLLAFYHPADGDVFLDAQKLRDTNANLWRNKCGVVMQDGYIFSGTIAQNIALSENEPNIERIDYAARIACIDTFFKQLPMGYNTKIGKTGIELSGGQKQRLFIARAIYKDPDFIFFDEATSSLDANNEREIMANLYEFYKGKTVVIVAHRLSTVKNANKIIFLDKGQIIEEGTHLELSKLNGAYYNLVKNQLEIGN